MTKRSIYMKMSLKDTTLIKRCGLQCVVKYFEEKTETFRRLFLEVLAILDTNKIVRKTEYALLSERCLFAQLYGS